jgi:hypothetical protein
MVTGDEGGGKARESPANQEVSLIIKDASSLAYTLAIGYLARYRYGRVRETRTAVCLPPRGFPARANFGAGSGGRAARVVFARLIGIEVISVIHVRGNLSRGKLSSRAGSRQVKSRYRKDGKV